MRRLKLQRLQALFDFLLLILSPFLYPLVKIGSKVIYI